MARVETHEQRISRLREAGRKGGMATVEKYGKWHMAAIGKAGKEVTVARYGFGHWVGLMAHKDPYRFDRIMASLDTDLAVGQMLAESV